jgi:di/tricarboxylate transporter
LNDEFVSAMGLDQQVAVAGVVAFVAVAAAVTDVGDGAAVIVFAEFLVKVARNLYVICALRGHVVDAVVVYGTCPHPLAILGSPRVVGSHRHDAAPSYFHVFDEAFQKAS